MSKEAKRTEELVLVEVPREAEKPQELTEEEVEELLTKVRYGEILEETMRVEELALPQPGAKLPAIVTDIIVGPLEKLVDFERIKNPEIRQRLEERRKRPAAIIVFRLKDAPIYGSDLLILSTHPNSKAVRFAEKYGSRIRKGMEIEVRVTDKGYLRIAV